MGVHEAARSRLPPTASRYSRVASIRPPHARAAIRPPRPTQQHCESCGAAIPASSSVCRRAKPTGSTSSMPTPGMAAMDGWPRIASACPRPERIGPLSRLALAKGRGLSASGSARWCSSRWLSWCRYRRSCACARSRPAPQLGQTANYPHQTPKSPERRYRSRSGRAATSSAPRCGECKVSRARVASQFDPSSQWLGPLYPSTAIAFAAMDVS